MNKADQFSVYDSAQQRSTALEEIRAIFQYRYLVVQFVRRFCPAAIDCPGRDSGDIPIPLSGCPVCPQRPPDALQTVRPGCRLDNVKSIGDDDHPDDRLFPRFRGQQGGVRGLCAERVGGLELFRSND